ncbi:MAG: DUF4330 family protein [Clostridia bacterium]|nr:DUF4330 family protein [Clostridia bacterium]
MKAAGKRRINVLDILLILAVVLLIVAFFFRTEIQKLFAKKGDVTITFSFQLDQADPQIAAGLAAGTVLKDEDGNVIGEILDCRVEEAVDLLSTADGRTVSVANGRKKLTCSVTAKGYVSEDFLYLGNGRMLVSGDRMNVSTGTVFAEILVLAVNSQ